MPLLTTILIILISSIVIFYAGNYFAQSSSNIGDYLKLPRSVKGATFDAIASSLPELLVALYAVIFFKSFEVGIGTIAGSALFNLLVIPGICVLVSPVVFKVSKKVISRDALFYIISVFILLVILLYFKTWGFIISAILLLTYLVYLKKIIKDTKKHQEEKPESPNISLLKDLSIFIIAVFIIGIATFFLTEQSIELANILKVSPIIIAFTITAAATSVPDTVISVVNAKKGNITDATSNVFGSNTFDILVGLGLPLLIYTLIKGPLEITFDNLEIILGLLGSTILVLYFLAEEHTLNKKQAWFLLFMYLVFIVYTVLLSLKVV